MSASSFFRRLMTLDLRRRRQGTIRKPVAPKLRAEALESRVNPSSQLQSGGVVHLPFTATEVEGTTGNNSAQVFTGNAQTNPTLLDFTDTGAAATVNDYTVTVTWGDGSASTFAAPYTNAPFAVTRTGLTSSFHVVPTSVQANAHVYEEAASGNIFTVQVTDVGSGATTGPVSAPFTPAINVTEVAVTVNASSGATLSAINEAGSTPANAVVGTFTDPGNPAGTLDPGQSATNPEYRALLRWGDGTTTALDSFHNPASFQSIGGGTFRVLAPAHTYAEEGTYTISLAVGHKQSPGANLVTNGGFETGNFTGWTQGGTTGNTGVAANTPHTGTSAAFLGPVGSDGTLSQNVATTPGQQYVLSFWLQNNGGTPNDFSASIGGTTVFSQTNIPAQGYTLYNFLFTATSASTPIQFAFRQDTSFFHLDDVSVVAASTANTATQPVNEVPVVVSAVANLPAISERGSTGNVVVATFTDPAGAEPVLEYAATINWGDGTTSAGTVANTGGNNFSVSGSHTYGEESGASPYAISVTVAHGPQAGNLVVNGGFETPGAGSYGGPAPQIPGWSLVPGTGGGVIEIGNFQPAYEGNQFTELNSNAPATIFQDVPTVVGQTYTFEFAFAARVGTTAADNNVTVSVGGTPITTVTTTSTAWTVNTFSFTATATTTRIQFASNSPAGDTVGGLIDGVQFAPLSGPATTTTHQTVNEVQITNLTGAGFAATFLEGNATTITFQDATFTDPAGAEPVSNYTATIDYGDGVTAPGTVVNIGGNNFGVIAAPHTYIEEGVYTVRVTVQHETAPPLTVVAGTNTILETQLTNFTVAAPPGTVEGSNAGPLTVATFTDPGGAEPQGLSHWYRGENNASDSAGTANGTIVGNVTFANGQVGRAFSFPGTVGSFVNLGTAASFSGTGPFSIAVGIRTTSGGVIVQQRDSQVDGEYILTVGGGVGGFITAPGKVTFSEFSNSTGFGFNFASNASVNDGNFHYIVAVRQADGTAQIYIDGVLDKSQAGFPPAPLNPAAGTYLGEDVRDSVLAFNGLMDEVQLYNRALPASEVAEDAAAFKAGISVINADYTATVDWGDGTGAHAANVVHTGGNNFAIQDGSHTFVEEGNHTLTVTVKHESAATLTGTAAYTVADVPVVATAGPVISATEGGSTNLVLLARFTDPAGPEALTEYDATVTWGDGTTADNTNDPNPNIFIVAVGSNQFLVEGTHIYTEESPAGGWQITTTVHHYSEVPSSPLDTTVNTQRAIVTDPSVNATGNFTFNAVEGATPATAQTLATFTDPGGAELTGGQPTPGEYTATINWGDSTPTTTGTITFSGGTFTVQGNHQYAEEGSYTISVLLRHGTSSNVTVTSTATVTDPAVVVSTTPLTVTANEGAAFSNVAVATFTDPGGNEPVTEYAATIDWGDGTTSPGTITFSAGTYTVLGSHTYAEESGATPYAIQVTVAHGTAPTAGTANLVANPGFETGNFSGWTQGGNTGSTGVNGVAPHSGNFAARLGPVGSDGTLSQNVATVVGQQYVFSFWLTNENSGTPNDFSASVNGTTVFSVTNDPAHGYQLHSFRFTATATSTPIQFAFRHNLRFFDLDDVSVSSVTASATVTDQQITVPVVTAPTGVLEGAATAANFTIATFTDPAGVGVETPAGDFTAAIAWGDGTPTNTGTVVSDGNGNYHVAAPAHTYAEEGTYTVTVTVTHDALAPVSGTAQVTVADQQITTPVAANLPVSGLEGAGIGAIASLARFTDPAGVGVETTADFTATVNWGDGTSGPGTVVSDGGGSYHVSAASHTYAEEGTYTVTVTIKHDLLSALTSNPQTITIADQQITNLVASNIPAIVKQGAPIGPVTGIVRFTDPAGVGVETTADFTATVNWGDGTTSLATVVSLGGGNYRVDAPAHTYVNPRTYSVNVTVTHDRLPAITSPNQITTVNPALIAVGPGEGGGAEVRVLNAQTGAMVAHYFPFGPGWKGSITVGLGDLKGDGHVDVVMGAGSGGAPRVVAYDVQTGALVANFFAYEPSFRGGINVSVGDVNGDGKADIVTGAGAGGAPRVVVFSGASVVTGAANPTMLASFFAYDSSFRNGVNVAAGDVNGDGKADIIAGVGTGGAPRVTVFRSGDFAQILSFFAYDSSFRDGVHVGAGDIDGDGKAEIITGAAGGGASHVEVFNGTTGARMRSFFAFNSTSRDGVYVGSVELTGNGTDSIVVGTGSGVQAQVKIFNGMTLQEEELFNAFDIGFIGGVKVS